VAGLRRPVSTAVPDLAPMIHRQRMVVEGTPEAPIGRSTIIDYLTGLGQAIDMTVLAAPVTHRSERFGWAGWVHWETSGAHFYAWEQPVLFFSVDIYTCKPFDPRAVVRFTESHLSTVQLVARSL
jgi:hypothetical protein